MLPINIQLGIGETITAIDKILSQRKEESKQIKDDLLLNLRQNLEIIRIIITKLEDIFIELLRNYRDMEILQNPEALKSLAAQTQIFLESRELLEKFEPAIGGIEAAAENPRFKGSDYKLMVRDLDNLAQKLNVYRIALGEGGYTGPGVLQLSTLKWRAEQQLNSGGLVDPKIPELAQQAFEEYDWTSSSDIRKLIGRVIMLTPPTKSSST